MRNGPLWNGDESHFNEFEIGNRFKDRTRRKWMDVNQIVCCPVCIANREKILSPFWRQCRWGLPIQRNRQRTMKTPIMRKLNEQLDFYIFHFYYCNDSPKQQITPLNSYLMYNIHNLLSLLPTFFSIRCILSWSAFYLFFCLLITSIIFIEMWLFSPTHVIKLLSIYFLSLTLCIYFIAVFLFLI